MSLDKQLINAVRENNIEEVRSLLDRGADVDGGIFINETSLYLAVEEGNAEMVKLLLQHGADVNIEREGILSDTPLDLAVEKNNEEVMFLLLLYGANIGEEEREKINEKPELASCLAAFEQIKAMPHLGRLIEANIKKEGAKAIANYINNKAEGQELSEEFKTIKEKYGFDEQLSFVSEYLSDFVEHMMLNYMINHKETNAIRDMAHLAKNPIKNKIDVPEEMFENIASYLDNQSLKNLHLAYHMSTDEDYGRAMNLLKRMKATESVLDQPGAVGLENLFRER